MRKYYYGIEKLDERIENIKASIAFKEGITINTEELKTVCQEYSARSMLSLDSCLQLFSLHIFQGRTYKETLEEFKKHYI